MRHQHKHLEKEHEAKMDLTPMIDVTFLLVMFFVLTSNLTTLNLEDVLLPVALEASEGGKEAVLIINIREKNKATREGEIVYNGNPVTPTELQDALRVEVQLDGARRGLEPPPAPGAQGLSKLEVLVRPDEGVRGEYLREVFMACSQVGIYKVKISAIED